MSQSSLITRVSSQPAVRPRTRPPRTPARVQLRSAPPPQLAGSQSAAAPGVRQQPLPNTVRLPEKGTALPSRLSLQEGRMKSRSSSPAINVYLNEATPVCVRVQKPKLLPSVVELSRVSKRKPSAGSAKWTKSQKGKTNDYHKSKTFEWGQNYKQQRPAQALKTTLSRIETISTLTHSNNANFDKEANIHERMNQCGQQIDRVMEDLKQLKNELNTSTEQFEEDLDGSNESKYMAEDLEAKQSWELSRTNYKHRAFWESFEKLQKKLDLKGLKRKGLAEENKLLIALKEAETTSLAAAKQVATLKNSIAELIQMNQLSTSRINKLAGEKDMLLEKVESSSIANQKLQQLLKDMQNQESSMDCTNMQMEVLMQKLTKSESENIASILHSLFLNISHLAFLSIGEMI
ncbi:uncharacterized protein LOC127568918 [Pristis pectinata]|uniref:uncharacterized protein LOC127568918 n=1 Tax=Pristis pectinata TaxID=685728 RepID=UPI00223D0A08|nr:uncharacterized protein LOC127568918 [Pristis pectinata]